MIVPIDANGLKADIAEDLFPTQNFSWSRFATRSVEQRTCSKRVKSDGRDPNATWPKRILLWCTTEYFAVWQRRISLIVLVAKLSAVPNGILAPFHIPWSLLNFWWSLLKQQWLRRI
jgi:hypothetical protein